MRSSGWRRARALALVAMVALLATACGSGGDDKSSSNGPVELTLQDHQKPRVELLRKLLPQFE
jgi:hypothetical protein